MRINVIHDCRLRIIRWIAVCHLLMHNPAHSLVERLHCRPWHTATAVYNLHSKHTLHLRIRRTHQTETVKSSGQHNTCGRSSSASVSNSDGAIDTDSDGESNEDTRQSSDGLAPLPHLKEGLRMLRPASTWPRVNRLLLMEPVSFRAASPSFPVACIPYLHGVS